jgi:hypothetical protein
MMRQVSLSFVHSDRVCAGEFDQVCAAAGFHPSRATQFGPSVYAGPSRSERRVAAAVAERLWLPSKVEPALTGSAFGFDDELPCGDGVATRYAPAYPAGAAALELALRHGSPHAAVVTKYATFQRIAAELTEMIPDHIARAPAGHPAASGLELTRLDVLGRLDRAIGALEAELASGALEGPVCAFLKRLGADRMAHPGGVLLDHLRATARRLERWRARPALVAAGLCHAVYGTQGFPHALLDSDQRLEFAGLVGCETEAIVYAYGCCDRAAGYPSLARPFIRDRFTGRRTPMFSALIRDFTELTCANELDVLQHAAGPTAEIACSLAKLLRPRRSLLSHAAWTSFQEALETLGLPSGEASSDELAP